jgi:ABC-2 type transport system ATP-binding protein
MIYRVLDYASYCLRSDRDHAGGGPAENPGSGGGARMISMQHVSRWYGQVIGLNDFSCTIGPGVTAILGPNGAGKTTLFRLLTGQIRPSTGDLRIFNEKPFANPRVFRRLGYCPESESSYDDMTGREMVTMLAALNGVRPLAPRVTEVIERVGMTPNADRKVGSYSKGMRQRIKMAQCLVHDPEILVLDEPLNGLDPPGRRDIAALAHSLADSGKCVLVSSHILHEVEQMTESIVLMSRGRLLAYGNVYHIRSLMDAYPHHISITTPEPRRLAAKLLDLPYVLSIRFKEEQPDFLEVETRSPEHFYAQFPEVMLQGDFTAHSFGSPDNNLESVFRYLVGGE